MPVHWSGCPITIFLIVVCCIVAAISRLGSDTGPVSRLYFSEPASKELLVELADRLDSIEEAGGENSPVFQEVLGQYEKLVKSTSSPLKEIERGQIWRLVTPMFLHFGPVHLIFNMMWLLTLGRVLETHLRSTRFALLVVVIAAVSNIAQALIGGSNFGGMSGVVYGLFGFVVMNGRLNPMGGLHLDPRTTRFMLIWLVLCFTGLLGPIANWAHTFGLLAGGGIGGVTALRSGGLKALRRRHEFRRAINASADAIHHCEVCGKTEHDDPDLEFRVGADGLEYCSGHLPE
ncbi:MAG TPA: rhomboid family intramembrane serine protease [Luteolibacter sp.]